ncbi:S8 family peptidase [Kroppenstedtia pulmonis]|uniref:S8 family peptidase n=1 Tax=Kroppenstedtia pulmonis TaxID=1380685 RepID=A0A7D3Y1C0_9BACL|nr:S8 family peptidase [Kroppenstedtia pulmonis]QKG85180.1 S8 family peptidase [Kroppenstedtia pulmonis]
MRSHGGSSYTLLSCKKSLINRIRRVGGIVHYISRYSGIVSAIIPHKRLKGILQAPGLLLVERDRQLVLPSPQYLKIWNRTFSTASGIPWNVERVWGKMPEPGAGKGVRVGIVDTGIDLHHPDLRQNIRGGVNLVQKGALPCDDHGHGTHVAGIVAARGHPGKVIGVAPSASLYAIKVLNIKGFCTVTTLIQAIDWGIKHKMDILNLSLGGGKAMPKVLIRAIQTAYRHGVLVVAAAGNSGNKAGTGDTVQTPARIPYSVAVSALDRGNRRSSFSATGPSLDIAAPGVEILSTYRYGKYALLQGTSQAAPHVSGALAVYKQRFPRATPTVLKKMLLSQAIPLKKKHLTGAGLVRIGP